MGFNTNGSQITGIAQADSTVTIYGVAGVTLLGTATVQTCTVTNDSGTVGRSNVTNVTVTCVTSTTTVSVSLRAVIPVGASAGSGSIIITNTGSSPAVNVSVYYGVVMHDVVFSAVVTVSV